MSVYSLIHQYAMRHDQIELGTEQVREQTLMKPRYDHACVLLHHPEAHQKRPTDTREKPPIANHLRLTKQFQLHTL